MSRKTVRVEIPENIDDLVLAVERVLLRNDGVLQPVPESTLPWQIADALGKPLTQPTPPSSLTPVSPTPAGTHSIPESIIGPLRTLYPVLKSQHRDYLVLRTKLQSLSELLQQKLGILPGQAVQSAGTARNMMSSIVKALLAVTAPNESEIETYGLTVVVGTAAVGRKPKQPA